MKVEHLEDSIRTLALVEPDDSPVISCYLDCTGEAAGYQRVLERRTCILRKTLPPGSFANFEAALQPIQFFLETKIGSLTRGVALFSRQGENPFFHGLQFEVALPNMVAVDSTPNLFHLVELEDNYDRYVVFLVTEHSAKIIGVNLGSITDLIIHRECEPHGHDRRWTKQQYQDHRRQSSRRFLGEQLDVLAGIMSSGPYADLILAGKHQGYGLGSEISTQASGNKAHRYDFCSRQYAGCRCDRFHA